MLTLIKPYYTFFTTLFALQSIVTISTLKMTKRVVIGGETMTEKETSTAPFVRKNERGLLDLTDEGHAALEPIVSDTSAQVYAFHKDETSRYAAGGMARLSRSSNDLRTIIASEFLTKETGAVGFFKRVLTEYGDDSVAQLDHDQVVFEGVSNVATKQIERGRLAAYLEQSTRYLRFDLKDAEGNYRYVIPEEFDAETAEVFKRDMDEIFDIYSELYIKAFEHIKKTSTVPEDERDRAWEVACHAKACDSIRGLLPAATKSTVGVSGSAQAIYNMILHMEAEPLPEVRSLGGMALEAVRIVNPVFYERADMPNRGGLIVDNKVKSHFNTRELAKQFTEDLDKEQSFEQETGIYVRLQTVDGSKDELIAKILTDNSDRPYEWWLSQVADLSEAHKDEVLDAYVGERDNRRVKPGRAYELLQYFFEIQCDIGAYRDIQRQRMVDALEWQDYQPYLGHSRPALIDEIDAVDLYERAFEISQTSYEQLQQKGYDSQAQYSVLFGHNIRFSFATNARSLYHSAELRTAIQGHDAYRTVYQQMVKQVEAAHPFITKHMKFLNTDDNAELARLDAAREQAARVAALAEQ